MQPTIILVRPQMGENIGAVARAMSNFGLSSLRIVAPRDGWPNQKAVDMAAGGAGIIEKATLYDTVAAAVSDLTHLYATTARPRELAIRVVEPSAAMQEIRAHARAGILFGPERTGLTNEDMLPCDAVISIPTSPENPSLNIAQSAVVVAYEWFKGVADDGLRMTDNMEHPAPKEQWQSLFTQMEEWLDAAGYFNLPEKKPYMLQNLKVMLQRGGWSEQELRSMRGILRALWEH